MVTTLDVEKRNPFWLRCAKCSYCWAAASTPMDVSKFVKLARRAACPMCGDAKPFIAKQKAGKLLEPEATSP